MDLQECIKFATENPVCHIATTDGDQPRVRAVLMWFADENGFYFAILSPKQVSKQLHKNPKIEVCFYNNPPELPQAKTMRIAGKVEFLEDQELIEKAYEERKFLDDLAGKPIKEFIEVFRIKSGDAHFWTMMDVLKEPQLEHLTF
jgi:pyridoxamine 5'-phosphate oxidase